MNIKKIIKMFKRGNCCVTGLRGTGKDLLMANVVIRRKKWYLSNVNYGGKYIPLDFNDLDVGNSYDNFISNKINKFLYPYEGADVYVSDSGIYFPSQYSSQLDKKYEGLSQFQALSRHLGNSNFHINTQSLNRIWNKIREQSDKYIRCNWCRVLFGNLVIQKVTIYEKYQSCLDNVHPNRIKAPNILCDKSVRQQYQFYVDNFNNQHGKIKSYLLIYINKSNYDSRRFKTLLAKYPNLKIELGDNND